MEWQDQSGLFALLTAELYTPVLGDVLDTLGYWHQFLPQPIHAAAPGMTVAGRAMTVQLADVTGPQSKPFGRLTEALDGLKPGEIYLVTGGSMNCASFGEIMTATARTRRAVGAVINGFHRDTPRVLEQNWPVFSRGCFAQDAGVRSSVVDIRCTIEIEGTVVRPGDLVFGDVDGVVVVPKDVEEKVMTLALEKARGEKLVRKAIEAGMSSTEAFQKYGIL